MNDIDYTPTDGYVYGYVIFDIVDNEYEDYASKAVKHLLGEFAFHTKNLISHKVACAYWIRNSLTQGIRCTNEDVEIAYTIAYGHGCEYEWEFE